MSLEKEFNRRHAALDRPADRLGPAGLLTLESKINSSRKIIYNHNIGHAVNIENPDFPLVYTGRENALGKYSSMLKKSKAKVEVVDEFRKNKYHYILVTYDPKKKHYDILRREHLDEESEGFATKYNNEFLDSLSIGDKIEEGQTTHISTAFDEHGNYCLGKNLNTLYMINVNTMEDSIVLMNGAENMMNSYSTQTIRMALDDNEVPLNLYDSDDNFKYKSFPMIGEKIQIGILMAKRRINSNISMYAIKNKYLKRIEQGDKIIYSDGKVIDINIYTNKNLKDLKDSPTHKQVNSLIIGQHQYFKRVYKTLKNIIDNAEDEGYTYSRDLSSLYREAFEKMDAGTYVGDANDNVYNNIVIEFKIMHKNRLVPGSKMTGRCG